jgi:hypothetical protein
MARCSFRVINQVSYKIAGVMIILYTARIVCKQRLCIHGICSPVSEVFNVCRQMQKKMVAFAIFRPLLDIDRAGLKFF